jgi:hypothetical protein
VEEETKLLPLTASVKAALPAVTLDGASEEIAGKGLALLMSNTAPLDAPPPGDGLLTVTVAVPALATSDAGTDAVSWVSLTKVVLNAWPFQSTADEATKLLPLTVSVKAGPPDVTAVGAKEVIAGAGLTEKTEAGAFGAAVIEDPPPQPHNRSPAAAIPKIERSFIISFQKSGNWIA